MRLPALAVLAAAPLRIPPVRGLGDAPAAPACSLGDVPAAALGDSVPLCVFLSASPPQKMAFRVKVDASAELLLRGSRQIATNQSAPVNVWVAASQASAAYPLDCADRADIDGRMHKASCPQDGHRWEDLGRQMEAALENLLTDPALPVVLFLPAGLHPRKYNSEGVPADPVQVDRKAWSHLGYLYDVGLGLDIGNLVCNMTWATLVWSVGLGTPWDNPRCQISPNELPSRPQV
ncbi:unnamed protein product, partial [Prorocentrum cordatum]